VRTIAIANQKGGVGKTTTALSLAASLAELNHPVLLIDFDPQANATTGLGFNAAELSSNIYTCLLSDDPIQKAIQGTRERNLSLIPSSINLAAAEVELAGMEHREYVLRTTLLPLDGSWDYVIIDSPPSLGLLTPQHTYGCTRGYHSDSRVSIMHSRDSRTCYARSVSSSSA